MLIKQITELELRVPGLPGRTYTPKTAYFHDKTKISIENLQVIYYLPLKYCWRQRALLSPTWAKLPTKFSSKI